MLPDDSNRATPERKSKVVRYEDLGRVITDALDHGGSLCLGGLLKQGRPTALVREVIKSGRRRLKLFSSPASGYDVDLLIAAGCVAETFLPVVTLEHRFCPFFRDAVERNTIKAHAVDALSIIGGLMATANGVPYQPVTAWAGSDVIELNPLIVRTSCPFEGTPLFATRAIQPDLALIHAQEADEFGNVRHLATMTYADALIAKAARKVIVSVDRIIPAEKILAEPSRTTIPGVYVTHVVQVPFGAHPTASFPNYSVDEDFIDAFADIGDAVRKDPAKRDMVDAYLERHVWQPIDPFDYLDSVGGYRRLAPLEDEARFI